MAAMMPLTPDVPQQAQGSAADRGVDTTGPGRVAPHRRPAPAVTAWPSAPALCSPPVITVGECRRRQAPPSACGSRGNQSLRTPSQRGWTAPVRKPQPGCRHRYPGTMAHRFVDASPMRHMFSRCGKNPRGRGTNPFSCRSCASASAGTPRRWPRHNAGAPLTWPGCRQLRGSWSLAEPEARRPAAWVT